MEEEYVNSLGGDMPQERLDRIKAAWIERYGRPDNWDEFKPALGVVYCIGNPDEEPQRESVIEFDNHSDIKFDHPLCPTPEELGNRSKKTADYHLAQADKYVTSSPAKARMHRREFETHTRIANMMFEISEDILKKGR